MLLGKYLLTGSTLGTVTMRDPSTKKVIQKATFHSGGVSSIDFMGSYLVSTGFSQRFLSLILVALIYWLTQLYKFSMSG